MNFLYGLIKHLSCLVFAVGMTLCARFLVVQIYVVYTGVNNLSELSEDYGMGMLVLFACAIVFVFAFGVSNSFINKIIRERMLK